MTDTTREQPQQPNPSHQERDDQESGRPVQLDHEKDQPGRGQPGQGHPGQGQPGQGQPGQGHPGQGQPGQGRPGQQPGSPAQRDPK